MRIQSLREMKWLDWGCLARMEHERRQECGSSALILRYFSLCYSISYWAEHPSFYLKTNIPYAATEEGSRAVREDRQHCWLGGSEPGCLGGRGSQTLTEEEESREEQAWRGGRVGVPFHISESELWAGQPVWGCVCTSSIQSISHRTRAFPGSASASKKPEILIKIFLKHIAQNISSSLKGYRTALLLLFFYKADYCCWSRYSVI